MLLAKSILVDSLVLLGNYNLRNQIDTVINILSPKINLFD